MTKLKLFLIIINFFGISYGSNFHYLNEAFATSYNQNPKCSLLSLNYNTSSATFYQTLFSTGKVTKCIVHPTGDTIIRYNSEDTKFNLVNIRLLKQIFKIGYSFQESKTTLLLINNLEKYVFQIKEKGKFEFNGVNDGKLFFTFIFNKCHIYFSIQLKHPRVELIEYTV